MITNLPGRIVTLRSVACRAEALAAVTVAMYDNLNWHEPDPQLAEHLAYVLEVAFDAAGDVVKAIDALRSDVDAQR